MCLYARRVDPGIPQGCRAWGEYVHGGSPVPEIQRRALQIFQAQLDHGSQLQATWQPRELNMRAYFLSRRLSRPNTPIGCCHTPSAGSMSDGGSTQSTASHTPQLASPWHTPSRANSAPSIFNRTWHGRILRSVGGTGIIGCSPPVLDIARTIVHLRMSRGGLALRALLSLLLPHGPRGWPRSARAAAGPRALRVWSCSNCPRPAFPSPATAAPLLTVVSC